jgi:protein TonB
MKFGDNISFSAVVHVMVITAAITLAGWNAASRAPEQYVMVTLIGHAATPRQEAGERPKKSAGESVQSVKRERLPEPAVPSSPLPEQREATPAPEPVKKSPVQDDAGPAREGQTEVRGQKQGDQSGGPQAISSGAMHVFVADSEARTDGLGTGKEKASGSEPRVISAIRATVERAKSYPPLAKRRKQEGTVVAEFSINAKGLPENVRVTRSSGFSLLDSAARETIIRAAPFPVVNGRIEVLISFVLK